MKERMKPTKAEIILMAMTAVFLCAMLALLLYGKATGAEGGYTVDTERSAAASELIPDMTPVNINTADAETLATLPGIGPTLAERIVRYREENGAFDDVEALTGVSGVGEKKLDEIRDRITVKEE